MKTFATFLAALQVASCIPHGPEGTTSSVKTTAKPTGTTSTPITPASTLAAPLPSSSAAGSVTPVATGVIAPAGCRKLSTDRDWPTEAQWTSALPGVLKRDTNLKAGVQRPDYHLSAKIAADVQKAVKFCAQNNIRLTILNSGHDFLGRNDAPSGLSLDVSQLGGVRVLNSFTPTAQGAQSPVGAQANVLAPTPGKQAAVTFGAGLSTQQLNNAISPSKLLTMGAAHGEVKTAGGWGQTGGHGPLTPQYGLGVDQFLEFKVVTADGSLKVANKVSNPDLFWALRGGGGGTFGVVVEATVKAYPDIPITVYNWWLNTTQPNSQGLWDAYGYLHTQFPSVVSKGVSGYYYWYNNALKGIMHHVDKGASPQQANAIWKPVLDKLQTFPTMGKWQAQAITYPNFKSYFDAGFGPIEGEEMEGMEGMGMRKRHGPDEGPFLPMPMGATVLDSRLLGADHFKSPNLVAALKAADPSKTGFLFGLLGHLTAGNKVMRPDDDTSVLPAWRKAYVHLVGLRVANVSNTDSLRKLAPDMGAYANEANTAEENWKQSFWGSNYARLSQIKTKYDPNMVFWATPGINADTMQVTNGRVCKLVGPLNSITAPSNDNQNPRDESVAGEGTGNDDPYSAFPGTSLALTADLKAWQPVSFNG